MNNNLKGFSVDILLKELIERPEEELNYVLLRLLCENKLDFLRVNQAYVAYLKHKTFVAKDLVSYSAGRVLASTIPLDKDADKDIVRDNLYFLHHSKKFNVYSLAHKHGLNPDKLKMEECVPIEFQYLYTDGEI